jgi:hypothetical protein
VINRRLRIHIGLLVLAGLTTAGAMSLSFALNSEIDVVAGLEADLRTLAQLKNRPESIRTSPGAVIASDARLAEHFEFMCRQAGIPRADALVHLQQVAGPGRAGVWEAAFGGLTLDQTCRILQPSSAHAQPLAPTAISLWAVPRRDDQLERWAVTLRLGTTETTDAR